GSLPHDDMEEPRSPQASASPGASPDRSAGPQPSTEPEWSNTVRGGVLTSAPAGEPPLPRSSCFPTSAAPGYRERAPVVRVQPPRQGPDDRLPRGRVRSVHRLLPPAALRPAGAGARPHGGVPTARRRLGGAQRHQHADGDGGRLRARRPRGGADP